MKKLFVIFLFVALGVTVNAQQGYQQFANDTTAGDSTNYTTATVNVKYNGFVTFDLTANGAAGGDVVTMILQGSNDNWTTVQNMDTLTHTGDTEADYHFVDNPAEYLRYRLEKTTGAGDTAYYSNQLFIFKR